MITQDQPLVWIIELMRFCGPTVVSCKVVTEKKNLWSEHTYPPSTLDHVPDLAELQK